MPVRVLSIYGYRGRLQHEWGTSHPDPRWTDVERAIRRLDAREYAGVVLHSDEYCEGEPARNCLSINGGRDGYFVTVVAPGSPELRWADPLKAVGAEPIAVCSCDQGLWVPAHQVCRDLATVLAVARHYFEDGTPAPEVTWARH